MKYEQLISRWQERVSDPELKRQLDALLASEDEAAIEDAFYRTLEFGTAGLRGVLGPGTNRMNVYTVGQATQGLCNYLNAHKKEGEQPSVAICYDSRINSELFARETAAICAGNGVVAWIYPRLEPTPALSFAVRHLGCDAGVNVTASHNPAKYNGYKVYGSDGCQIASAMADEIQASIQNTDAFDDVKRADFEEALAAGQIHWIGDETIEAFLDAVQQQSVSAAGDNDVPLKLVYTPLNGTGRECVLAVLKRIGIDDVTVVPEQEYPDGNFPTCPYPNPEMREALQKGIDLCEQVHPDLLLATDPDADRVGTAVKAGDDYVLPTGNEMGVLLLDYIGRVHSENGTLPANPVAVTTIVSTDMVDAVAAKYGIEIRRVLTGFKYIGGVIADLEAEGHPERFVFGFEESYGYLAGTHARDKDAVVASMLICQMARYYRARGKSLADALEDLYREHGYYRNKTVTAEFDGVAGAAAMDSLMAGLRAEPPAEIGGLAVQAVLDYKAGVSGLPSANVLEFDLEGGQKVIFRPSGTEPKVKAYVFAHAATEEETEQLRAKLVAASEGILGK